MLTILDLIFFLAFCSLTREEIWAEEDFATASTRLPIRVKSFDLLLKNWSRLE